MRNEGLTEETEIKGESHIHIHIRISKHKLQRHKEPICKEN